MNNGLKYYYKSFIFLFSLYSLFFILYSAPSAQAEGIDLGIYPPVIQIDANPPASVRAPITIENDGDTDVTAEIQYKLFKASAEENGTLTYLTGSSAIPSPDHDLFKKVQLYENDHVVTSVKLAPKQQKKLELHIGIEKTAVPADYYFSIIFRALQSDAYTDTTDTSLENQNASITTGGIATNVLLSIGPKEKPTAKIKEFSTPSFVSSGPLPFTLRIENTGKHSIQPTGAIFIKNVFGQYVGKVDILPETILAHSIRSLADKQSIEDNTASAVYHLNNEATKPFLVWPETFLFGPYTAGVYLKLSENGPVLTKTIYFFAFPWQGVIVLIILILLCIIIREKIKQRRRA